MRKSKIRLVAPGWLSDKSFWPPFFNKGMLVYEESGHPLTIVGKYYVCAQKQKGKCSNDCEKMIDKDKLEKKFKDQFKNLELTQDKAMDLICDLAKFKIDIERGAVKEINSIRDKVGGTLFLVRQDLSRGKKVSKEDIADLRKLALELMKAAHPNFIFYMIQNAINGLTAYKYNNDNNIRKQPISSLVKRAYIDNNGNFTEISLEGIGDYLFQYIESVMPGFTKKLGISIIERIKFPSLDFDKVIDFFKENDFRNSYSDCHLSNKNREEKFLKELFKGVNKFSQANFLAFGDFIKDYIWIGPNEQMCPIYFKVNVKK